jgi:hypothetical protein
MLAAAGVLVLGGAASGLGVVHGELRWAWLFARAGAELMAVGVITLRLIRHRERPLPWIAFAAAFAAWTEGDVLDALHAHEPAIACWIVCYALVYAGLALLTRPPPPPRPRSPAPSSPAARPRCGSPASRWR